MSERGEQAVGGESGHARALADIVGEAIDLAVADRDAFLVRACAGDDALLSRARSLVASHERAAKAGFFAQPTGDTIASGAEAAGQGGPSAAEIAREGTRIGAYLLGRCVGAGGFGVVYDATQDEPIRRRVAIKILRAGMASPQVVARFESERRALAMMEHPGIAKVLDAGATPEGVPYFVMEFVEGEPLVAFCDRQRLGLRDRIELIVQVCRALQHAHAKGVIHRDIKPANILAAMQDGRPAARIIDFGIAKAVEHVSAARAAFTRARQMIGTPEYMSPEQAGASTDIDTRSDIYSLGVVLYEVLAGVGPFDAEKLRSAAFAELERVLREDEPPRPSTRLSSLASSPSATTRISDIAATRRIDERALMRELRGELDWVVLRCLEKDRARRYETAAALGDDLERYLRHEAVVARPPSRRYQFSKLIRRHRAAFAAGVVALVSLVAGLGMSLSALTRARAAQQVAVEAEASERVERQRAEIEAKKARAGAEFLGAVLASADPMTGSRDMTVADALDQAVALIRGGQLREDPEVEAVSRRAIGMSYLALGKHDKALEQLDAALAIARSNEIDPVEKARCISVRALIEADLYRHELAEPMLREAIGLLRDQPGTRARSELAACMRDLTVCLFSLRRYDESTAMLEETRKLYAEVVGTDSVEYADLMAHEAASIHANPRDLQPMIDAIAAYKRQFGPQHPRIAVMLTQLAASHRFLGNFKPMVESDEEAIAISRHAYGPDHYAVISPMVSLAIGFGSFNALAEAKYWLDVARESIKRTNDSRLDLELDRLEVSAGEIAALGGDHEAAVRHFEAAMEAHERIPRAPSDFTRFNPHVGLVDALMQVGRLDDAEKIGSAVLADPDPDVKKSGPWVQMQSVMGELLTKRGRYEQAEALLLKADEQMATMFYFKGTRTLIRNCARAIALYEAWEKAQPNRGYVERAAPFREKLADWESRLSKRVEELGVIVDTYRQERGGTLLPKDAGAEKAAPSPALAR